ncbi:hypothetical protein CG51_05315 [Haematobacter missouriensis]|uniref:Uncharacterized protein n=1 Tax=Haematobacter missouriensis TaxID=366616 RepID=A0A212AHW1_9RHOB|nr:hypothetical protein CG51_05315 [Haematobacter missouriensis]OWJ72404.1 hypothetical protein CDV53_17560 [Haematobacter missouriensis]OWJ81092.1 hypothetical protein CDV52_19625 [Haematobacter missouriensis]
MAMTHGYDVLDEEHPFMVMSGARPFICAICERPGWRRWPGPIQCHPIAPCCALCERKWGIAMLPAGAFRDRRIVGLIFALANALESEARQQFYRRYGYGAP